jgi:hypothetical protein
MMDIDDISASDDNSHSILKPTAATTTTTTTTTTSSSSMVGPDDSQLPWVEKYRPKRYVRGEKETVISIVCR